MLTQPENNITLSSEQSQAIEEVKNRLANIESEVSIATKNLRVIKADSEKAIKDKAYQEELLVSVSAQVVEKQSILDNLNSSINEASTKLSNLQSEINTKVELQAKMNKELKEREEKIEYQEKVLFTKGNLLDSYREELEQKNNDFNLKVTKLEEVLKQL